MADATPHRRKPSRAAAVRPAPQQLTRSTLSSAGLPGAHSPADDKVAGGTGGAGVRTWGRWDVRECGHGGTGVSDAGAPCCRTRQRRRLRPEEAPRHRLRLRRGHQDRQRLLPLRGGGRPDRRLAGPPRRRDGRARRRRHDQRDHHRGHPGRPVAVRHRARRRPGARAVRGQRARRAARGGALGDRPQRGHRDRHRADRGPLGHRADRGGLHRRPGHLRPRGHDVPAAGHLAPADLRPGPARRPHPGAGRRPGRRHGQRGRPARDRRRDRPGRRRCRRDHHQRAAGRVLQLLPRLPGRDPHPEQ